MDKIKNLGTAIMDVLPPTIQTYSALLQANAKAIKSTPRETHSYGSHPRQELDVYKPDAPLDSAPVVMWIHGGGFTRGAKNMEGVPDDLTYANVGHFFASRGYVAVIINYRLVGVHGAKFPSGGEDVALAVEWVIKNYGGKRDLFLLGNSAGGCHLSTFVFWPEFKDTLQKITDPQAGGVSLKGVGFVAVPYVFLEPPEYRVGVLKEYYGEDINSRCTLGLVESAPEEIWSLLKRGGVQFKLVYCELDPEDEIIRPLHAFEEAWFKKRGDSPEVSKLHVGGHNHISHFMGLGTGIASEETWGLVLLRWMNDARG